MKRLAIAVPSVEYHLLLWWSFVPEGGSFKVILNAGVRGSPVPLQTASSEEDREVENVREAMLAAFAAVDEGDVLQASFDHLRGPSLPSSSQVSSCPSQQSLLPSYITRMATQLLGKAVLGEHWQFDLMSKMVKAHPT